jgi:hypothetical protein
MSIRAGCRMQFYTIMSRELKRLPIPACGAPHQTTVFSGR